MIAEEANQEQTENKNQNKEIRMATEMKIRRMSDMHSTKRALRLCRLADFSASRCYALRELSQATCTAGGHDCLALVSIRKTML